MSALFPDRPRPGCASCRSRLASVFADLDERAIARLDRAHIPHSYHRGQILFYEGNPCRAVFCVGSGVAKVYRNTSRQRSHILYLAGQGYVLGLPAVLAGGAFTATGEMVEDGTVCQIDREVLDRILAQRPGLWRALARALAEQLRRAEKDVTDLASKDLRERLATVLLALAARHGDADSRGIVLAVELSRDDLANLVGASTEATIRQLGDFRRRRLITTGRRAIRLEDPSRLARIARLAEQETAEA